VSSSRPIPKGRLPDFFIVGAPKCGTTSMYAYLREHPGIFLPFHKEPLFFGSDLTHRYGRLTPQEYVALFRDARPDQLVGEASAWYLYSETAAREIRDAAPDARIVVMLRNPIDVMYAQHSQLLFTRQESIATFAEALAAEPRRLEGRDLPPGSFRRENLYYRRMVRFADQLERYLEAFGRERVHVIVFDDLRADTRAVYLRLLDFLGVEPYEPAAFQARNESQRIRSGWLQRLTWDPPFKRQLVPVLRRFPLAHRVRGALVRANSVAAPRPPLDPDLRARLARELAPEVARLGRLLDRDLSDWSVDAAASADAAPAGDVLS
jgi:Sulfotransferase domain